MTNFGGAGGSSSPKTQSQPIQSQPCFFVAFLSFLFYGVAVPEQRTVFRMASFLNEKFGKFGISFDDNYNQNQNDFCGCPFDNATIDFVGKRIFFSKDTFPSTLIHELGHLLFGIGKNRSGISGIDLPEDEWHGWEMLVAREFESDFFDQFLAENADYVVYNDGRMLMDLNRRQLKRYISKAEKLAFENLSASFR